MADIVSPFLLESKTAVGYSTQASACWAAEITPEDDDLIKGCRELYIGTGGDLVITFTDPAGVATPVTVTYANVPDAYRIALGGGAWITVDETTSCSDIVAHF